MELTSDAIAGISVIVMVIAAVALVAVIRRYRRASPPRDSRVEVARISEVIEATAAGSVCLVMLIMHQVACYLWMRAATSAIQEAAAAAIWIGGNVLWGLGVALGRRRTYIITRAKSDGR